MTEDILYEEILAWLEGAESDLEQHFECQYDMETNAVRRTLQWVLDKLDEM